MDSYPAEKLSTARRCLMLPHLQGEIQSIVSAFHECSLGLHNLKIEDLDDEVKNLVSILEELMSTDNLQDVSGMGLWYEKAKLLSDKEKYKLSDVIDQLANLL